MKQPNQEVTEKERTDSDDEKTWSRRLDIVNTLLEAQDIVYNRRRYSS